MSVVTNFESGGLSSTGNVVAPTLGTHLGAPPKSLPTGAWYYPGWVDDPNDYRGPPWDHAWFWLPGFPERTPVGGPYNELLPSSMDTSMKLAKAAGIDFFAFNWYYNSVTKTPMGDHAIRNFMSSSETGIRFAIGFESGTATPPVANLQDVLTICKYWKACFKDSRYLRINGRPWMAMVKMDNVHSVVAPAAGVSHAKLLEIIRQETGENIYFVASTGVLNFWVDQANKAGYDGFTQYNLGAVWTDKDNATLGPLPTKYSELAANYATEWAWQAKNLPMDFWLPTTIGFNNAPWAGTDNYGLATALELENHFKAAKTVGDNSNKVKGYLCYAWNEHAEAGGLYPDAGYGTARAAAHKKVFKS